MQHSPCEHMAAHIANREHKAQGRRLESAVQGEPQSMIAVSARRLVLHGSRHTGAHAVKLDAAADAAVLDIAAAADSRLPLVRHGDSNGCQKHTVTVCLRKA